MRRAVEIHPGGARERDASVGLGWGMGVDFESHGPTLLKRRRRGDDERSLALRGLEISFAGWGSRTRPIPAPVIARPGRQAIPWTSRFHRCVLREHAVHKATGIDARLCILTAPRAREIGEPCSAPDDEQQTE